MAKVTGNFFTLQSTP